MKLNIHSFIHILGCYALTLTFYILNVPYYIIFTFILGILWEIFDYCNWWYDLNISFLDPSGDDYMDIVMNSIGILLAIGMISI